jgi:hypothetical protein
MVSIQLAAETGRATRSADDPPKLETEGSKVGGETTLFLQQELSKHGTLYQAQ